MKTPEDQIGISGGVASFVCQATGEPKPRITWMKKGKKVSSQRFEVCSEWTFAFNFRKMIIYWMELSRIKSEDWKEYYISHMYFLELDYSTLYIA